MSATTAPSRAGYSQEEVEAHVAMAAFVIYTLNKKLITGEQPMDHNVWNAIGYWRNLMKVDISYAGKDHEVIIHRAKGKEYQFEAMGEKVAMKLEHVDKGSLDFSLDNKMFLATFKLGEGGFTNVMINGKEFLMMRNDLLDANLAIEGSEESSSAGNVIHSPIPGKVFKIKVKVGDEVSKGDVVVVIDAMKMENNIKAKKGGKIKKILVSLNDMVEVNAALVELE